MKMDVYHVGTLLPTIFFGVLASLTATALARAKEVRSPIEAGIRVSLQGQPIAGCHLGSVTPGKEENFELLLHNETGSPIVFDEATAACSCQNVEPTSGRIKEGESMRFHFRFRPSVRPTGAFQTGTLQFLENGKQAFRVDLAFGFDKHFGFRAPSIVVEESGQEEGDKIVFSSRMVIGEEIDPTTLSFSLSKPAPEATFSLVDDRVDVCFTIDEKTIKSGFWSGAIVADDKSGKTATQKVVIRLTEELSVVPAVARFAIKEDDTAATCRVFITASKSGEHLLSPICYAKFNEQNVTIRVVPKTPSLAEAFVTLPIAKVKEWTVGAKDKVVTAPHSLQLSVQAKKSSIEKTVPVVFVFGR